MAKKQKENQEATSDEAGTSGVLTTPESKNIFREVAEILFFGLSLLLFYKGYSWQNFQIPTGSMENTLLIGDHITANTFIYKPASALEKKLLPFRDVKRGDIVVFKWPGSPREDWIKRCIGVPGDRYSLKEDALYLNGQLMDEGYAFYKEPRVGENTRCPDLGWRPCDYYTLKPGLHNAMFRKNDSRELNELIEKTRFHLKRGYKELDPEVLQSLLDRLNAAQRNDEVVIPEGFYLMMGDNRNNSFDSRDWGLVPKELVQGRAYFVWWSYGEDEDSHVLTGKDLIWSYLRVPIEFFRRTHWDKTFTLIE